MLRSYAVLLFFLASGCVPFPGAFRYVPVHSTVLSKDFHGQPLGTEDVGVFLPSDVIPGDCERVALLRAAAGAAVVDTLRAEAGRLGANAVDLRDFRTPGANRSEHADPYWDAVALYCPGGDG